MEFNIQDAAFDALDPNLSRYRRALRLYEMLIAIYRCKRAPKPTQASHVVHVSDWVMRQARLIVATSMMEQIDQQLRQTSSFSSGDLLRACADDPDFSYLYNSVFLLAGGWGSDRRRKNAREFTASLRNAQIDAKRLGAALSISARFESIPSRPKMTGGSNMVIDRTPEMPWFKKKNYSVKKSELENCWKRLRPVSVWICLQWMSKDRLPFPKPKYKGFVSKLLDIVDTPDRLSNYFALYNATCARLRGSGYHVCRLKGRIRLPKASLPIEPMSPEETAIIVAYRS